MQFYSQYRKSGISRGARPGVTAVAAGGAPLPVPRAVPAGAAAYLADNRIAPFLWFAHLTTNQAILDAAELAADPATGMELDLDETLAVNCVPFLHKLGGGGFRGRVVLFRGGGVRRRGLQVQRRRSQGRRGSRGKGLSRSGAEP